MFKNLLLFFNRLKYKVVFSVSSFIKTDEHQELLKKVDTQLLIWDHQLINLDTGKSCVLEDMKARNIATAAKEITAKGAKIKQTLHAALYLPDIEFVATIYELPEVAAQNISSALSYQIDELMPAYPGKLMLAVNHNESRAKNIALWLDQFRTEELFAAFKEHNIELTSIIPRIALAFLKKEVLSAKNKTHQFREYDENGLLHVALENKSLLQWYSINNNDQNDKNYFRQWEKETEPLDDIMLIGDSAFWQQIDRSQLEQLRYTFFPEAARNNLKQRSRLKKGRLAIIVGVIAAVLLATPFILNSIRYAMWDSQYQAHKEKTTEVRTMRSTVTRFEENWGLFIDYPRPDVMAVVKKLNSIIPQDSWIKGFEIKSGVVEIDGYSPNPTGILEVISRQREFEQASFNQRTRTERGKNNEHFGITFHLNSINMEAYQDKYFPVN